MILYIMMLGVTACYTITTFSDRYAAHTAKFPGHEFTFLMCASLSVFMLFSLPFQEIRFTLTWQSFAAILLIALCKYFEFEMTAYVFDELTPFELKAWLGVNLFVSYFTDVFLGEELRIARLGCIVLTGIGLVLIVRSDKKEKPNYRRVIIPMILYMLSKYGYSLVIRGFSPYISSTVMLIPALILLTVITLFKVKPLEIIRGNKKGAAIVISARIPNTVGMLLENAIIAISITHYSFIQPMILVTLFLIGLIRERGRTGTELAGSVICVAGITLFALV